MEKHEKEAVKNLRTSRFLEREAKTIVNNDVVSTGVTNQEILNVINNLQIRNRPNKLKQFFFGLPKFSTLSVLLELKKNIENFTPCLDLLLLHSLLDVTYKDGVPLYGLTDYGAIFVSGENNEPNV